MVIWKDQVSRTSLKFVPYIHLTDQMNPRNPDELVTIYAGPERKAFRVHKEVACLYSPVLKAAFNSNFIEGQTQAYTLEGCDKAFQLIVQWMYRQPITPPATKEEYNLIRAKLRSVRSTQDFEILHKIVRHSCDLVSAWLIADYLQIPRLQNYLVDQTEQLRLDTCLSAFLWIGFLYKNVPRSAAIRKLVFEQYVRFLPAEEYEKKSELFPKEFLLDYVIRDKRLQEKKQAELDPFRDRAEFKRRFHVPEEGMIA
jgi:hypothetical protein